MTGKLCRSFAAGILAVLLVLAPVAPAFAQAQSPSPLPPPAQAPTPPAAPAQQQNQQPAQTAPQPMPPFHFSLAPDYSRPKPSFPNVFAPYSPFHIAPPQFTNSPHIEQLIHNGQLRISLQDAVELALENNINIAVQRYYPWIADTEILRAKGGGAIRGIPTVGTPLPTASLPLYDFDPFVSSSYSMDDREIPVNNPLTAGLGTGATAASLSTHSTIANFQYSQSFHTGTTITLGFDNTRNSTSSKVSLFNPSVQTVTSIAFSQPLLNGFGFLSVDRYIRVAQIAKQATNLAFEQSVITDINQVEDAYWDLVYDRDDVGVNQQAVAVAQNLLSDNQKQVQVGTLAPIEVVSAEAQLALAQQQLIDSQTAVLQQQTLLLSLITKDPLVLANRNIEIIPTSAVQTPPPIENISLADAVREALTNRPDFLEAVKNLEADEIDVRSSRSAMLPSLTVSGYVDSTGLGGDSKITTSTPVAGSPVVQADGLTPAFGLDQNGNIVPLYEPSAQSTVTGIQPGGFGDAASQAFRGVFPEYEAQVTLTIPIRNRQAQADNARALLSQRQDQTLLQQLRNNVVTDVRNTQIALQQARAALDAAQKTLAFQQQSLDAEEKKLQLGTSTTFLVAQAQSNLQSAATAEVRDLTNLAKARVDFERALGRTLSVNSITISDALSGSPVRSTLIPGTEANGQLVGEKARY
jgi:outer membrane protein